MIIATIPYLKGEKSFGTFSGHLMEADIECFYWEHIHALYETGKAGVNGFLRKSVSPSPGNSSAFSSWSGLLTGNKV